MEKLLEIQNLQTYFFTEAGTAKAVDGVDLTIHQGETLGVVGESGCGKSVTSLSILGLVPTPPGRIMGGKIIFDEQDLLTFSNQEMRHIRGNQISMIFQEPMTSLNPVYTVGDQISESLMLHKMLSKKEALQEAHSMLLKVGIPEPKQRLKEFPHQLSGGLRQRVMIAMALSCDPHLLIADEPTTALDVTIQSQILKLLNKMQEMQEMSIMLITHDLGVIAEMAENVAVMYAGKVVEYTDVRTLFKHPLHPYTWGLMNSIPQINQTAERLPVIPGIVPNPMNLPSGCKYHPRCQLADEKCRVEDPPLEEIESKHITRCWKYDQIDRLEKQL